MVEIINKFESRAVEAAVFGSIMQNADCVGKVLVILPDADFFWFPEHRIIFKIIFDLYFDFTNRHIDGLLVRDELERTGQLEQIGGFDYLRKIIESTPTSANVEFYARAVRKYKQQRDIIEAVDDIQKAVQEHSKPDDQVQKIQEIALGIGKQSTESDYYSLTNNVEDVALQERADFIETGLRNIDNIVNGVLAGELLIIAGRPSMGKSSLALQFALNMAKRGLSIVFFTLEMTYKSLIQRALLNESVAELKKLDVVLHEGATTPEKQIAFIKTRKQTHGVDVVFIDYLQLMSSGRKDENRVQEITTITRKLKLAAISESVPIIALSQLSRAVENREKHKPRLSDLRESGSIEQDADVVMLLNREDYYRRNEDPDAPQDGNAEVIIAKNRRGFVGVAGLVFLDEQVRFGDKNVFSAEKRI